MQGTAIVTGCATGIGRSIALRLAQEGYNIVLNDIQSKAKDLDALEKDIASATASGSRSDLAAMGQPQSLVVPADVSSEAEAKNLVDAAVQKFGGLDVMVANAGIIRSSSIVDVTAEEWDTVITVNLRGAFLCYKYAAEQMIKQGRGGRIIGASSVAGKQGSETVAYATSKWGIRGLTQSSALSLAKHGITVNAYAPGAIETPLLRNAAEQSGDAKAFIDKLCDGSPKLTPVGYVGHPDVIASLVAYLVKKEAHYVTGQTISVNGGAFFD